MPRFLFSEVSKSILLSVAPAASTKEHGSSPQYDPDLRGGRRMVWHEARAFYGAHRQPGDTVVLW